MKYNTGGRGNTPIINDRNMGKIGTMSQSNPVTTHGIFNNITIGDYKGSKVFRDWGKADEIHECEIRLVLTEPSDKNMVYAVKVNFRKGLQCEDLDVKEFVDSEDYMHFLSSFKATLEDSEEETK